MGELKKKGLILIMENTDSKKMNFFVRVYKSITNFDIYGTFAEEPLSKAINYITTLIVLYSIIVALIYVSVFHSEMSEGIQYLNDNVEHMSFIDGALSYNDDEYTIYEGEDNILPIVIVDTSDDPDLEAYEEKASLYDYGVILLKNKIMVYTETDGEYAELTYAELGIEDMDKEEILEMFNASAVYTYMGISMFIVEFVENFINVLMNAIVLAIIARLIGIIIRLKMSFKSAYIIGIYSFTLSILLELIYIIINTATGFVITYFTWLYTMIPYIYVCIAVLMMGTDFINTQRELMKIKLEEEKNKYEVLEDKQDDEKESKDKEDSDEDKSKDKKDEDDELKEQTDG